MDKFKTKAKNDDPSPSFDFIGLGALLIGIDGPIRLFAQSMWCVFIPLIVICLAVLFRFARRYNRKNILVALFLICATHPTRFMFDWWLNPIVYGVITLIFLGVLARVIWLYKWRNALAALLLVCSLLSGWQMVVSASEVGHCFVDDIRWTYYIYCKPTRTGYYQIDGLPIGMQGYCYDCPWYH